MGKAPEAGMGKDQGVFYKVLCLDCGGRGLVAFSTTEKIIRKYGVKLITRKLERENIRKN